ncbi:hypothetical protein [Streptomyces sp. ODS28]|uniref:ATP-grasp domain-containing protein n=1 Tax=Streptomyces sp. ODS28 TaxID=3136688 RepID=UPI0031EA772A
MSHNPLIALVTARPRPEINTDHDLPELERAVGEAGGVPEVVYWDEPGVDWGRFDLAVLRSTWDYVLRVEEFLTWAEHAASRTTLANPPSVLRWNSDKRYLGELAERGVPAVPTRYMAPGDPVELPAGHEYVVKPTTGAGARYAARYRPEDEDEALAQVRRMHAEGLTAMVQPYLRRIDTSGERALVFYGGRLVHAVRKNAVLEHGTAYDARKTAHPGLRAWTPTDAELAVAEKALAAVPEAAGTGELLYARVDLADDDLGSPQLMELELIEPNLFLRVIPDSLPVVAETLVGAASRTAPRTGSRANSRTDSAG